MTRKSMIFLVLVILVLLFASVSTVLADPPAPLTQSGDILIIAPEAQYNLTTEDDVRFIGVWIVCRARGLVQAFHGVGVIELYVDGQQLVGTRKDNEPYWWDTQVLATDDPQCNNHSDTTYIGWWVYDYGTMTEGTHEVLATINFNHNTTDLYDAWPAGPDGKPDLYRPGSFDVSTTINVSSAP